MMKRAASLRVLLLPTLLCALLGTGVLWITTPVVYAASSQAHVSHPAAITDVCPSGNAEMDTASSGVICSHYKPGLEPENISSIDSGNHSLSCAYIYPHGIQFTNDATHHTGQADAYDTISCSVF